MGEYFTRAWLQSVGATPVLDEEEVMGRDCVCVVHDRLIRHFHALKRPLPSFIYCSKISEAGRVMSMGEVVSADVREYYGLWTPGLHYQRSKTDTQVFRVFWKNLFLPSPQLIDILERTKMA